MKGVPRLSATLGSFDGRRGGSRTLDPGLIRTVLSPLSYTPMSVRSSLGRDRTDDLHLVEVLLYQLSYEAVCGAYGIRTRGLQLDKLAC
jgi:hypothetical protein